MQDLVEELKTWERDFKAIHGRKPELKDTPEPILEKYKSVLAWKNKRAKLAAEEPIVLPKCSAPGANKQRVPAPAPVRMEEDPDFAMRAAPANVNASKSKTYESLKRTKLVMEDPAQSLLADDKPMDFAQFQEQRRAAAPASNAVQTNTKKKKEEEVPSLPSATPNFFHTSSSSKSGADNFVRLNLKNDWKERKVATSSGGGRQGAKSSKKSNKRDFEEREANKADVVSTILDLMEGGGGGGEDEKEEKNVSLRCGHNLPCQEFTVKKLANRGRKFYGCSLGWKGSCGFFQWKDDTAGAAKRAFLTTTNTNASCSGEPTQTQEETPSTAPMLDWIAPLSLSELKLRLSRLNFPLPKPANKAELRTALATGWAQRAEEARALDLANPSLETVLQTVFFHQDFLPSQRAAVERLLVHRKNTLVISSTGSGKSLIYQLPAFVLPHLTLVISPLISLMLDQVSQLPPGLRGRVLNGTQAQQATVLGEVIAGRVKILYISPERLFTQSFQTFARKLTCSLVCVDEAHCMTSWSHNFRPCYLRLGEVIPKLFPSALVLALTATATVAVQREICTSLGINLAPEDGGRSATTSWQRDNLKIQVELVENGSGSVASGKRFARLAELLKQQKSGKASSIVYASTKYETTVLAERLASQHGITSVAAYHAGLDYRERKATQERFLANKLQVVVATVAFGMGLNKPNVRNVFHYGMPRSIEEYAQEIGRAGRDGEDADCILFYDVEEAQRLLALSKSDGLERSQLEILLNLLRRGEGQGQSQGRCIVPVFCTETSLLMDCKESTVETLLVFLSKHGYCELAANGYGRAQVELGTRKVNAPPIVHALKYLGCGVVDLIQLANEVRRMSKEDGETMSLANVIRQLNAAKEDGFLATLVLQDPCWFVDTSILSGADVFASEEVLEAMLDYCNSLERKASESVELMYSMCELGQQSDDGARAMRTEISNYLEQELAAPASKGLGIPRKELDDIAKRAILGDAKSLALHDPLFTSHASALRTSRALTRILCAITSTVFTYEVWSKHRIWGRYKEYDFDDIKQFLAGELKI